MSVTDLSNDRVWRCFYTLLLKSASMASLHPNTDPQPGLADEELEEIRRYEDFTTIDWIQDSILERNRRINKAQTVYNEERGPKGEVTARWLWANLRKVADAGQTWFVVSLVGTCPLLLPSRPSSHTYTTIGICIGVNAALISIITEWLSDIKMGYCSDGWWLNQQFCCWEIESDETDVCDSWHPWSNVTVARMFIYVLFAVCPISINF